MTDIPKLTDAEAAALRFSAHLRDMGEAACDAMCRRLVDTGLGDERQGINPSGRAALAAYDAQKRAEIRREVIEECIAVVVSARLTGTGDIWQALADLRALLAKEGR